MKEVEVKYKISNRQKVMDALKKSGVVLGAVNRQEDISYAPKGYDYSRTGQGIPFLRIRRQNGRAILTLKKPMSNHLDKLELETNISDPVQMEGIINELGYEQDQRITKDRIKGEHAGYEICLDSVEALGDFIEVESMIEDDENSEEAQESMRVLLKEILGDEFDNLVDARTGYDVLMRIKNGQITYKF